MMVAPGLLPMMVSPMLNDAVGDLSLIQPSTASHSTKFATAPVVPPVTDSGTLNAPVIPAGAADRDVDAVVYPLPAVSTSIIFTDLYSDPPLTILMDLRTPFSKVGTRFAATPPLSGLYYFLHSSFCCVMY